VDNCVDKVRETPERLCTDPVENAREVVDAGVIFSI